MNKKIYNVDCRTTVIAEEGERIIKTSLFNAGNNIVIIRDESEEPNEHTTACCYRLSLMGKVINAEKKNGETAYDLIESSNNACLSFIVVDDNVYSIMNNKKKDNSFKELEIDFDMDDSEIIRRALGIDVDVIEVWD